MLNIVKTFISILKILIKYKKTEIRSNYRDNSLLILGNGPSTNLENINKIQPKNQSYLAVNNFAQSNLYILTKPAYYVLLDPNFFTLSKSGTQDEIFHFIEKSTMWPMELFVPNGFTKPKINNNHVTIKTFNYIVYEGHSNLGHLIYSKNIAMPQSQNILVASLFIGLNLGYKNIYLLGAEHSWHKNLTVTRDNVLCLEHEHFYTSESDKKPIPFYKTKEKKETFTVAEAFTAFAKVFKGYEAINKYAAYKKAKIYNLTPDSFIDAFERKQL